MLQCKLLISLLLIVFSLGPSSFIYGQSTKKFNQMTNQEIDTLIHQFSQKPMRITEKMNQLSNYFLGVPYNLKCIGDGPYALFEPWPLVNFKETNCMALCEHVLALAISDNWDNFFNNLQQIRYKDGLIGMKTRNHYTMADWLPQNNWLLHDASSNVGGDFAKTVTRTISHRKFFSGKGITDLSQVLPDRTITLDYIPLTDFENVLDKTRAGDILTLLYANLDNIFSAHMVMITENEKGKIIRESSSSKMTTFDTPIEEWIKQKSKLNPQRYLGISIIRVNNEINNAGKIIYPSEIGDLKRIN